MPRYNQKTRPSEPSPLKRAPAKKIAKRKTSTTAATKRRKEKQDETAPSSRSSPLPASQAIMRNKYEILYNGEHKKTNKKASAKASDADVDAEDANRKVSTSKLECVVNYDPNKYKKIVNVLNGQSGKGLCYRNGVMRMGGKPFMKKLESISEGLILEMVYRTFRLSRTRDLCTVSPAMVCYVAKGMGFNPICQS